MIGINRQIGLVVISTLLTLFVGGCSKKADVAYDDSSSKSISSTKKQIADKTTTTDKLSKDSDSKDKLSQDPIKKESYINVVTSNVNGKDIALKSVHFSFDKFNLSDEMRIITKDNYSIISPLTLENKDLKIKLEGNCDEWGTDEYNYALGLKRAKTVKDALVSDGIPASKIVLVTFGESNPLCSDKSENCWKKNRRTDYRLLP